MERHFEYLWTNGLKSEAGRDANQASIAIEYSKIVRCIGLVLSSNRKAEDSPPANMEGEV